MRFLGLYDLVDMALGYGEAEAVSSNVETAAVIFASRTSDQVGVAANLDPQVQQRSRQYFDRVDGAPESAAAEYHQIWLFGTHSALGGAAWAGDAVPGHRDLIDRAKAEEADQHVRNVAISKNSPSTWWTTMAMIHSAPQATNFGTNLPMRILLLLVLMTQSPGCARADKQGVYRESRGQVIKVTAEVKDPVIRVAVFAELKDGSAVFPNLFYGQVKKTISGVRKLEKPARIFVTLGKDGSPISNPLWLPVSEDIRDHLLLVRRSFPKDSIPNYVKDTERGRYNEIRGRNPDYRWANWQLYRIPAGEVTTDQPFAIPTYEDLAKQDLSDEDRELLSRLVKRYREIEDAAWAKASTPVKPTDKLSE